MLTVHLPPSGGGLRPQRDRDVVRLADLLNSLICVFMMSNTTLTASLV